MPTDITLTLAEVETLEAVEQNWLTGRQPLRRGDATALLIQQALAAVPRLALASPVVGELVAVARDYDLWMGDYLYGGGLFNPEMADHVVVRDSLMRFRDRFRAALTGEEGRDG